MATDKGIVFQLSEFSKGKLTLPSELGYLLPQGQLNVQSANTYIGLGLDRNSM